MSTVWPSDERTEEAVHNIMDHIQSYFPKIAKRGAAAIKNRAVAGVYAVGRAAAAGASTVGRGAAAAWDAVAFWRRWGKTKEEVTMKEDKEEVTIKED